MKTVACLGGGTDSTAMVIEAVRVGAPPTLTIFADTGNEKPGTYEHVWRFAEWMEQRGLPLVIVRRTYAGHVSLGDRCKAEKDMPSRVYGHGTCAYDWKLYPTWAYLRNLTGDEPWERWIGFNTDEDHRRRDKQDEKGHHLRYPLIEAGIDRAGCRSIIRAAGLPIPPKSACWFCPASKPAEVTELRDKNPDLYEDACEMEAIATGPGGRARDVVGLGRTWPWRSLRGQGTLNFDAADVPDCGVCIT